MKKLITFALLLLSIAAGAQEMEILDSIRVEADVMYGTPGYTMWQSKHMRFSLSDKGTLEWEIINPPHIFIADRSKLTGKSLGYSNARVGLFAENDSLLAMVDKWKALPSEYGKILRLTADATFNRPNGEKMKGTILHVLGTLMQRKGSYVRVVTNVYGDHYFEVKARMK